MQSRPEAPGPQSRKFPHQLAAAANVGSLLLRPAAARGLSPLTTANARRQHLCRASGKRHRLLRARRRLRQSGLFGCMSTLKSLLRDDTCVMCLGGGCRFGAPAAIAAASFFLRLASFISNATCRMRCVTPCRVGQLTVTHLGSLCRRQHGPTLGMRLVCVCDCPAGAASVHVSLNSMEGFQVSMSKMSEHIAPKPCPQVQVGQLGPQQGLDLIRSGSELLRSSWCNYMAAACSLLAAVDRKRAQADSNGAQKGRCLPAARCSPPSAAGAARTAAWSCATASSGSCRRAKGIVCTLTVHHEGGKLDGI